ncbi:putative ABC transporter ATP-binding protein [Maritalea myrionectae]|uniref:Putative ABC transporter ATP-binding protein n=2 Tax=Maritalea myrionectae TaxID=454601 RepID=A0A2R4MGU5_9HYPH|nr:putative ABC transporter ATP-binding protein [Maritalea myrionectae]
MLNSIFNWFERIYPPTELAKNPHPPQGVKDFYIYFLTQFRWGLAAKMALVAVGATIDAMIPVFLGQLVELTTNGTPGNVFATHGMMLLAFALVILARPASFILSALLQFHTIFPPMMARTRWQSHWHVVRQSWSYFQRDFAGRIANKIMETGNSLVDSAMQVIDSVWYMIIFLIVAITVLAEVEPIFIVPLLIWLVAYAAIMVFFLPRIARRSKENSDARSVVTGRIVDCYTNIQTLKTFASSKFEDEYVAGSVKSHTKVLHRLMREFTQMWSLLYVINALLMVGAGYMAIIFWNNGDLSPGKLATIIPFIWQTVNISGWILDVASGVFRDIGNVQDGMDTIARPITMLDDEDAPELEAENTQIEFNQVHFAYDSDKVKDKPRVIENLNLTIKAGEKIGLIGRSGAGKSTLVNLLLRLFDAQAGEIKIDGHRIDHVTQDSLRRAIGFVSQDTSLLHRSVGENIKYGRPYASDADMIAAAKQAKIHDVILGLEDENGNKGYDARVGERGVKLSGGQRQRIAIARVLLKDAPILILDEATSALDSEVEAAIQEQLQHLMTNKTVIAIAHRLSTIAAMDRLLVMDQGRIVEEGTHEELLKANGHYASLWRRQSGGFANMEGADPAIPSS